MARKNDASITAGAVEVCSRELGPNVIMPLDEKNRLSSFNLHTMHEIWCYIKMRTPSKGEKWHYFEEEEEAPSYTEIMFETLNKLRNIISCLYSIVFWMMPWLNFWIVS